MALLRPNGVMKVRRFLSVWGSCVAGVPTSAPHHGYRHSPARRSGTGRAYFRSNRQDKNIADRMWFRRYSSRVDYRRMTAYRRSRAHGIG